MENYPLHVQFNGRIMVIGAHPDDAELMAGGIISRAVSQGSEIYSIVITDGCENGEVAIRQKEARKAARILGIKEVVFCGIKDGRVPHNIEMVKMVERYITDIEPSMIITHCNEDTHQDHKNVCNVTISAARRRPNTILMGETPSSYMDNSLIHFDITDTLLPKIRALQAYRSQIRNGPINIHNVRMLAAYRGGKANARYAEAFKNWRLLL